MASHRKQTSTRSRSRRRPVPGARQHLPEGMQTYLVLLHDDPAADATAARGRGALAELWLARTGELRRRIEEWLERSDCRSEVVEIGEPNVQPFLTLVCTGPVAHAIAELEGVDTVVSDADEIGLIP